MKAGAEANGANGEMSNIEASKDGTYTELVTNCKDPNAGKSCTNLLDLYHREIRYYTATLYRVA